MWDGAPSPVPEPALTQRYCILLVQSDVLAGYLTLVARRAMWTRPVDTSCEHDREYDCEHDCDFWSRAALLGKTGSSDTRRCPFPRPFPVLSPPPLLAEEGR